MAGLKGSMRTGGALPQIKSNPITGSSVSAWGKSTSFQTTSQAAQLDLFYKKPGAGQSAAAPAGQSIPAGAISAPGATNQLSSSLKGAGATLSATGGAAGFGATGSGSGAGAGAAAAGGFHGLTSQAPLKPQREEMSSMYNTSIATAAHANTGKRGAEGGYCFLAEWFDTTAAVVRKYNFLFFPLDSSVEMYDIKNKRTFLKRCPFPTLNLKDLHVGATITVYGRQLKLVAFGDEYTRSQLEDVKARTLAVVRPEAYGHMGKIVDSVLRHGLSVGNMKLCKLSPKEATDFTGSEAAGAQLAGKPILAVEIIGKDSQAVLSGVSGASADSKDAKAAGGQTLKNVMASGSGAAAASELSFFFEQPRATPALLSSNVTVCVVRPHAVSAGHTGAIIDALLTAGFEITALESFALDKTAAEEFLEVYRGVLPEYSALVEQMATGLSVAIELVQHDPKRDTVAALREVCGPVDPVIGKHIRPNSLRARFGVNRVQNAVHCTDLPEDGPLESEFFFSILQKK